MKPKGTQLYTLSVAIVVSLDLFVVHSLLAAALSAIGMLATSVIGMYDGQKIGNNAREGE